MAWRSDECGPGLWQPAINNARGTVSARIEPRSRRVRPRQRRAPLRPGCVPCARSSGNSAPARRSAASEAIPVWTKWPERRSAARHFVAPGIPVDGAPALGAFCAGLLGEPPSRGRSGILAKESDSLTKGSWPSAHRTACAWTWSIDRSSMSSRPAWAPSRKSRPPTWPIVCCCPDVRTPTSRQGAGSDPISIEHATI